jgi:hypothetical protein
MYNAYYNDGDEITIFKADTAEIMTGNAIRMDSEHYMAHYAMRADKYAFIVTIVFSSRDAFQKHGLTTVFSEGFKMLLESYDHIELYDSGFVDPQTPSRYVDFFIM